MGEWTVAKRESDQKRLIRWAPGPIGPDPFCCGSSCDGKSLWQWSFPLWFWPECFRCWFQRVWLLLGGPGLFCWCFLYNSSISIKQSLYGSFLPEINRSTLSSNRTIFGYGGWMMHSYGSTYGLSGPTSQLPLFPNWYLKKCLKENAV